MLHDRSPRPRERRARDSAWLQGTLLSTALHTLALALVLLAPHRMRPAAPTAYTVEVVDPSALGGKLLAGPIGGAAARRADVPPPAASASEPEPEPEEPPVVAKAEPEEKIVEEPEHDEDDADAVPLATARPTPPPRPTRKAEPTVRVTPAAPARATIRPTASPAVARRPAASPIARAVAMRPSARPSPERGTQRGGATPGPGDIDSQLAAAIRGVETNVGRSGGRGVGGEGRGGGMGGTESRLDGPPGIGGDGPGGGGTVRGLEFLLYYNQMLSRIKESWAWVGGRADLRVKVSFSILENGEIVNLRLLERSGDPSYDTSVERAVKRASPLAPPPAAYRKDFTDVELTFRPADLQRPSG